MSSKPSLFIVLALAAAACSSRGPKEAFTTVSGDDVSKNAGADPMPKAGTKILAAMPLARARTEIASLVAKDPAIATIASVGSGDEGFELHVMVENKGQCPIKSVEGVAYGFDPKGGSTKLNKSGVHYVAFKSDLKIEPGKKGLVSQKLHHAELATLAVAQVDKTVCENGTTWERK